MSPRMVNVFEQSLDDKEDGRLLNSGSETQLCDSHSSPSSSSSPPLMDYMYTPNSDSDYLDTQPPTELGLERRAEEYMMGAYNRDVAEESETSDDSDNSSAWSEESSENETEYDYNSPSLPVPLPMMFMLDCFQCNIPQADSGDSPSPRQQPYDPYGEWRSGESAADSPPPSFEYYDLAATNEQPHPSEPTGHRSIIQLLSENDLIPERDLSTRSACYGPQGELIGYYPQSIDEVEPMCVKYVQPLRGPWSSMVQSAREPSELGSKWEEALGCRWGFRLRDEFEG